MRPAPILALLFAAVAVSLSAQPRITGVANAASGTPGIAASSWVSIFGGDLASNTRPWTSADFTAGAPPTSLDRVSVTIGGKKTAIAYISPTQLNVQAPIDLPAGPVPVQVATPNGMATASANFVPYQPALFAIQGKYVAARHNADSVYVAPAGLFGASTTSRPAQPGELLQLYGTGFGPTTPAVAAGDAVPRALPLADLSQLRITFGGVPAAIQFAGIVSPGLYQLNVAVPLVDDGDQPVLATIAGQTSPTGLAVNVRNAGRPAVTLTLGPAGRTIRCGTTLALTVSMTNTFDQAVTWEVNGQAGTVSATGVYTAPAVLPANPTVTVTAISHFDPTVKASLTISLQNPVPVVTSVSPAQFTPGSATLTVNGTGFAAGALLTVAGTPLNTTVVSDTKITATANLTMPVGRMAALKVANPNPGAAVSTPISVVVRPAAERMTYANATRFLRLASWGPSPQTVVELQTIGADAWLTAQFAKAASKWPDPNTATEGVARLQTAFWNVALAGDDQLRQRAAFALSQLLVVSAVKDVQFQQMVPYLRLMGENAFGSYRDLVTAITLHPAMGDYLDMVNNEKANPATGTVANENYARELLQLFTLGLVQLDPQGQPVTVAGATLPVYDQSTVAELAKVTTGWTYAQTPGYGSLWRNMPYYFAPMIPFQERHDTTGKRLNLPSPCTIPSGGTAESDLNAAIDCIFQQQNVAPFVSYRLIQRFVMSDPSPAYVGRVATAFQSSKGSLRSVLAAILTDPEAQGEGSGKLGEPVLFATGLLRALDARIAAPDALTAQAAAMGQTPLAPGTVFSFFLPSYRVPSLPGQPVAPEFQALNDATALARANFAYRAVTNGISGGIVVDLANLQDLANRPADLVEAVSQALFSGEMDSRTRDILLTAANASTNLLTRVRSVLYAAAASPQYQAPR